MAKVVEGTELVVAAIPMSPEAALQAVPVLVTVTEAPAVLESRTLSEPAVMLQVVDEPPLEVKVTLVL